MQKAAEYLAGLVRSELAGERLTPGQLVVIVAVAGSEGLNCVEIADITHLDRTTVADVVLKLQRLRAVTAAALDIGHPHERFDSLCRRLEELGVPLVFYSGYGEAPDAWRHVPLIAKPGRDEDLVKTVAQLRVTRNA
jgi:hypothetical protein